MKVLETIEADIKQIGLLISYHENIIADAKLYHRPTERALEELTVAYLKEMRNELVRLGAKMEVADAGYLPVEEVQLEGLTDENIRQAMKKAMDEAQHYGDDGKPIPEREVAQATIDAVKKQCGGKVYRVKG